MKIQGGDVTIGIAMFYVAVMLVYMKIWIVAILHTVILISMSVIAPWVFAFKI